MSPVLPGPGSSGPGCQTDVGVPQHLAVADVEGLDPSLLPAGEGDEEAQFDQFGVGEMLVELLPQSVVGDGGVPQDGARVPEGRLLTFREALRGLELEQFAVVGFGQSFPSSLDGSLDPSIFAGDRFGHIDPAQLLDLVIEDTVEEGGAPGLGEGVEDGRYVSADRLAFGAGGAVHPPVLDDLSVLGGESVQIRVFDAWHVTSWGESSGVRPPGR